MPSASGDAHHNRSVDDWIHNRESGMIACLRVLYFFTLEGVPESEIDLYKVVVSQIWEDITNFAEAPDVGSKTIFQATADVAHGN